MEQRRKKGDDGKTVKEQRERNNKQRDKNLKMSKKIREKLIRLGDGCPPWQACERFV